MGYSTRSKILDPDEWTMELFFEFFDITRKCLLEVMEESIVSGSISGALNSTFITLIPKYSHPEDLNDYHPISLCNLVYKLITKIIGNRMKPLLSCEVSSEQFSFMEDRYILEVVRVAQETLHIINKRVKKDMILQLDLNKAYDRVNQGFLCLVLMQVSPPYLAIKCIMACVSSVNFAV